MIKSFTPWLAVASAGVVAMGATACKDTDKPAAQTAPTAATSTAAPNPASSAPAPSTVPTSPPPSKVPASHAPKPGGSDIIMIDPDGKKYTRKKMIQLAAGMAMASGKHLPRNFCAKSYQEGVSGGGKFPAGRAAFIEACEVGVGMAS